MQLTAGSMHAFEYSNPCTSICFGETLSGHNLKLKVLSTELPVESSVYRL